jgi:hypothetical protein
MAERGPHQYPPVGDTDRLDAILRRGRFLRRRRQLGVGAGGTMAAVAVVAVLITAWPAGSSTDSMIADEDTSTTTTTEPTTTASTTVDTPAPDGMQVTIDASGSTIHVSVVDPEQPVPLPTDDPARQCVLVGVTDGDGQPVAEGWECDAGTTAPTPLQLTPAGPADATIICPAQTTRVDPAERQTGYAESAFEVGLPAGLAPGSYELTVEAASGLGDGCAGKSIPEEVENEASATETIQVP